MGAEAKGDNLIKDDPKIYAVLIDGFTKGFTDAEACESAGVSLSTLFRYCDINPDFQERKENLKLNPIITAKSTVVAKLDDVNVAFKYLQHRSDEFKPKPETQINQLFIGTDDQMKDRLAAKLCLMLGLGNNDSQVDVSDAEVIDG